MSKSCRSSSYIGSGFLKCHVRQTAPPFNSRTFIYCLHCLKLVSLSWFRYHQKDVQFECSESTLAKHKARQSRYIEDITAEVDLLNDSGKLFKEKSEASGHRQSKQPDLRMQFSQVEPEQRSLDQVFQVDSVFEGDEQVDNDGSDESYTFVRTIECLCECFEKECFVNGKFDISSFFRL